MFTIVACEKDDVPSGQYDWSKHIPFETSYQTFNMPITDQFLSLPEEMGTVALSEASGIACSIKNPGMLWAHNDSGHPNTLFLINALNGEIVARYKVTGTVNLDWEDMEISNGPMEGEPYIYVADTGDNDEKRPNYSIYRFIEPTFEESHQGQMVQVNNIEVDRIRFIYPDGSHDAEGLLVDPITLDIFLVTKRDVVSTLYVAPYPQPLDKISTLYTAGYFSFREASAATASLDGEKVMIKNRQQIFYWERNENETTVEMLARTPVSAPYVGEPQGEAICFDLEYNYFTLSEALNVDTKPILYKYSFKL